MDKLDIDGSSIRSVQDFHDTLMRSNLFPSFYGGNYNALLDSLTGLVELPLTIIWRNSSLSKGWLGEDFDKLVGVMRKAESFSKSKADRFELILEE